MTYITAYADIQQYAIARRVSSEQITRTPLNFIRRNEHVVHFPDICRQHALQIFFNFQKTHVQVNTQTYL